MNNIASTEFAEVLVAANIKPLKEPKKYKELTETDFQLLHFVANNCSTSDSFPSTGVQWRAFKQDYSGHARTSGITLPALTVWNKVLKIRY